jgi:hypothetical protein
MTGHSRVTRSLLHVCLAVAAMMHESELFFFDAPLIGSPYDALRYTDWSLQ